MKPTSSVDQMVVYKPERTFCSSVVWRLPFSQASNNRILEFLEDGQYWIICSINKALLCKTLQDIQPIHCMYWDGVVQT